MVSIAMKPNGDLPTSPYKDVLITAETNTSNPDETSVNVANAVHRYNKVDHEASKLSTIKLWTVLIITAIFCAILLVGAHISHSLTLRVEAYHSLYNLLSLTGCLLSMKLCRDGDSLKNTFGWARVELLSTICTLLFLGSLCFGVAVDCIQTAVHAGHQDPMHYPSYIIALGVIGLVVNVVVFFIIGGYSHHQGCLLGQKNTIVWVKQPALIVSSNGKGNNSDQKDNTKLKANQGVHGTLRDISGLIFVIVCSVIVLWDGGQTLALYVDPAFAIGSATLLLFLSYPYGRECCRILLQTIPGHIDVQSFSRRLLRKFPEIVNVHHLHIWSLTPGKVVATAHVVFSNPRVYKKLSRELSDFFNEEEISKVTLQPEFVTLMDSFPSSNASSCHCLLQCKSTECENMHGCQGCTEDINTSRNIDKEKLYSIEDSYRNINSESGMKEISSFDTTLRDIRTTAQFATDLKGNSDTCIVQRGDAILRSPFKKLCMHEDKSSFHSLQDLRIIRPSSHSGRFGEYLAALQELRIKDIRNSVEHL